MDLKAERRIISKICMLQYIPVDIFRTSFKFFMGDKLREKMEGGKRDETFLGAFYCANTCTNCIPKQIENCRSPFQNETLHQERSKKPGSYVSKLLTIK